MYLNRNVIIIFLMILLFSIYNVWDLKKNCTYNSINNNLSKNFKNPLNSNKDIYYKFNKGKIITVKTDVLLLHINTLGGDIVDSWILPYKDKLGSKKPFRLLKTCNNFNYQAQSELVNSKDIHNKSCIRTLYNTNKNFYVLSKNKNELLVPFFYKNKNGFLLKKVFVFERGKFYLHVKYYIYNGSNNNISVNLFSQIKQSINLPKNNLSNLKFFNLYNGTAYSTDKKKYNKFLFKDFSYKKLNVEIKSGWISMFQKYFATAWIPKTNIYNTLYTDISHNNEAIIGLKSRPINLSSKDKKIVDSILWLGPEIPKQMSSVAKNLDLLIDYGWFGFISRPLLVLLKFINSYVGNLGFSIILITFILRFIMFPFSMIQYITTAKVKMLEPEINYIKKKFSNDLIRQNKEIIELYKRENINPLGSFLTVIIQMPIFLSLYYMLSTSIELRHAPFIFWIKDLSDKDPYYVLPILMCISMYFVQSFSNYDIKSLKQKYFKIFISIVFSLIFLCFPSGLVLYYLVSNFITIFQQKLILNSFNKI